MRPLSSLSRFGPIRLILLSLSLLLGLATTAPVAAQATSDAPWIELGEGALAYVPASVDRRRPAPLMVVLHGWAPGIGPDWMLTAFRRQADHYGVVLLAPTPAGEGWDMIVAMVDRRDHVATRIEGPGRADLSVDPPRIHRAMARLARRVSIDARRVALAGFSDGASYALTLGTHNPALFSTVISLSPGVSYLPREPSPRQRVFLAHGTEDDVLPYAVSAHQVVPALRGKVDLLFRPFPGRHILRGRIVSEAFDFFLQPSTAPPPAAAN